MAVPTPSTATLIVTEALKKAGYSSPSVAQITRGENEFMAEIKNDIWRREKKLRSLHTTSVMALTEGLWRYAVPTGYASDLSLTLMKGDETGTAQEGTSSSITLAADEGVTETNILGYEIVIYGGTAEGSYSQCTAYNTTTKKATVSPNFETTPDSTSTYLVVDHYGELDKTSPWALDRENSSLTSPRGEPTKFMVDIGSDKIYFHPVPDDTVYAVKSRFYLNLLTLDLNDAQLVLIYQRWRSVFIQGVKAKQLEDDDDTLATRQINIYNAMLAQLISDEVSYDGEESITVAPDRG